MQATYSHLVLRRVLDRDLALLWKYEVAKSSVQTVSFYDDAQNVALLFQSAWFDCAQNYSHSDEPLSLLNSIS